MAHLELFDEGEIEEIPEKASETRDLDTDNEQSRRWLRSDEVEKSPPKKSKEKFVVSEEGTQAMNRVTQALKARRKALTKVAGKSAVSEMKSFNERNPPFVVHEVNEQYKAQEMLSTEIIHLPEQEASNIPSSAGRASGSPALAATGQTVTDPQRISSDTDARGKLHVQMPTRCSEEDQQQVVEAGEMTGITAEREEGCVQLSNEEHPDNQESQERAHESIRANLARASIQSAPNPTESSEIPAIMKNNVTLNEEPKEKIVNGKNIIDDQTNTTNPEVNKKGGIDTSSQESEFTSSDSDMEPGRKEHKAKQKKGKHLTKTAWLRKNKENSNVIKTTKRNFEKVATVNLRGESSRLKQHKGPPPPSISGTLKAFFFNQQKRKRDSEIEVSDAEILEAATDPVLGISQHQLEPEVAQEGTPNSDLTKALMEKRKAALEFRRQIVERDELRRQSTLKEQQEKTVGKEERSQKSQQTDKTVDILQERNNGTQEKSLTNMQASIREEVSTLPKQTHQEKDMWLIDLRPNGSKGQLNPSHQEQTPAKIRATHNKSQLRDSGADITKQTSTDTEVHTIRLSDSLFMEAMVTPRKTPNTPKLTNNERLSEKPISMQKETPNKKTDLMTIMSAIRIALAPYCKLYEAIKEGIHDNTSILASMSAKITHIENCMTSIESKTTDQQKDWEKEVEELKKQIRSLTMTKNQEEEKTRNSQKGVSVGRTEESHRDEEEKDPGLNGQLPYPIKSGLCIKAKKKPPVLLKLTNNEKAQKQEMAEKVNQQDPNKQKENKEKTRKVSLRDTQERATKEKKMSSPRSTEDFMYDTNMINISQHWETASDNSVIEVSQDNQESEQQERVQEKAISEAKKKQKKIERQQNPEKEKQKDKKEDTEKYSRDYKQRRQSTTHRKENTKSNDNNDKVRTNKTEKQVRIFKVTQSDLNRGHMILNRRTFLKIMSTMQSLKKIRTEDIMLVEPYHRGKIAKAYIHLKEECIQNMDKIVGRVMEENGLELTEITIDKQTVNLDSYLNRQGERKTRYTSRTEECYRRNRIGKKQEVDDYSRERAYVHDKYRKEYQKRTRNENNKLYGQRRNDQQGTETSKHRLRRDTRCDKQQASPRYRCPSGGKEKWGKPVLVNTKTKAPGTGPVAWIKAALNLNSEN
ncbi:golgin subfamily A member 6-like protein 6 [Ambystoma mexicanum]|uniref:golgin subfamily A member 6-like protein 6 n=1 Tax=Ambystoma mexicanum TaxID=8296 RepID=UPI0037E92306